MHNFDRECANFASIVLYLVNTSKSHTKLVKIAHEKVQKCVIFHITKFSDIIPAIVLDCEDSVCFCAPLQYANYLEPHSSEGVRNVYKRACTVHLPKKPSIHLNWAAFEEKQGNFG